MQLIKSHLLILLLLRFIMPSRICRKVMPSWQPARSAKNNLLKGNKRDLANLVDRILVAAVIFEESLYA
ncbi:MAG: hypothetical protein DRQ60_00715 [Gammaproteobacteria bacterium]|nr:MAG: hypothetical protein DRQ54_08205 [Gammaproteobacteria bacterium]RLA13657.1 MAG: hypothetical protein DRQ52_05830 [Gammaproteobacteria bacterium]RLA17940.1 MAG: hypothetical protein DRQ60_00715 [Gammaproteobacteria bacterium]